VYGLVYGLSGSEKFRDVENKKPPEGGYAESSVTTTVIQD
jgi:hypothetical protein